MPAPKKPNTARATEKAAEARNRERDQRDAERLRARGWTVIPPDDADLYWAVAEAVKEVEAHRTAHPRRPPC